MYNRRRDQRLRRDPTVNGTAVAIRKRLKEAYHCLLRSFSQEKRPSDRLIRLPVTSCLCFKPVWGGYMPRVISVSEFIDPDYSWIACSFRCKVCMTDLYLIVAHLFVHLLYSK